ncbi:hypothetical protein FHX49_002089 [Microbacterium endophyticum]|uniref:Uncharacterized protein n=1 Tax=Microbacterium endophyticum TaxID=1526412 RepID=A0A7W4V4E9_9MICO|nr:hypothetical protein [Microbacterium endophyticum]MBB2976514.1 hypothetical protein [Microbacterium endophyticum]NIK35960.1 hypothetical protein [Microbacterium endophyticum]
MDWVSDNTAGAWLRDRIDEPWRGTMHDVSPRGFPAYARIFHPGFRDRPVDQPWPPLPYRSHEREWEAFQHSAPEIDTENVTWTETARAHGTQMHSEAQWQRLVAPGVIVEHEDKPRDSDGWRYSSPMLGELDPGVLSHLARDLAAHTSIPHDGFVALWEGWGDLVGHLGVTPSRVFYSVTDDDRHNEMLARSISSPIDDAFRKPRWQPGILADEVSRGGRLNLPGRDYVLFRGDISGFTDANWFENVPWRDLEAESAGFAPSAHSPSLVWPADHSWALTSEVDFDSTILAGSSELIRAVCANPDIEALPIAEGSSLQWDADEINQ